MVLNTPHGTERTSYGGDALHESVGYEIFISIKLMRDASMIYSYLVCEYDVIRILKLVQKNKAQFGN